MEMAAALIDKHIHSHYTIYANNKIACDLLDGSQRFAKEYTAEEKAAFEKYIAGQIEKINIADKDIPYLRERLLEMYANPLRNKLIAIN